MGISGVPPEELAETLGTEGTGGVGGMAGAVLLLLLVVGLGEDMYEETRSCNWLSLMEAS